VRANGVDHFLRSNASVADEFHRREYVVNIELRDLRRVCEAARRAAVFIFAQALTGVVFQQADLLRRLKR